MNNEKWMKTHFPAENGKTTRNDFYLAQQQAQWEDLERSILYGNRFFCSILC